MNTHGIRWKNFYRSLDKKGGNRYEAKCGFCLVTFEGRPGRLHNHVLRCAQWPMLEKTLYIQKASKDVAKNVQTKRPREEVGSVNAPQQQSILGWPFRSLVTGTLLLRHLKLILPILAVLC